MTCDEHQTRERGKKKRKKKGGEGRKRQSYEMRVNLRLDSPRTSTTIVALAVSLLVKSSLKDFVVPFLSPSLRCRLCHDLSPSMSLRRCLFSFTPVHPFVHLFLFASRFLFASTLFPSAFSSFSACQSLVPPRSSLVHPDSFSTPLRPPEFRLRGGYTSHVHLDCFCLLFRCPICEHDLSTTKA